MTAPLLPFPVPEGLHCSACNKAPTTVQVAEADYRCPGCGADLGHLDIAPNGMVRSVLGWLRQPGDVLQGRYRIRGFLGKGGFAATYLVEDLRLAGKRRAVKEIPAIFFDERETEILARIHHPAVPDITDRFEVDEMVYLVLEFGGDRTLENVREAEGGRVPLSHLRPWVDQLCDVLAHLHGQNPPIVHRDLKPANVLLDETDRVMLIDFGIAKEAHSDAATRTVARSASHGFSPPEQVLGTGTGERSDVYALGATIYMLLTGEPPPPAHERVAGSEITPPRQIVRDLPLAVEEALLRALELNVAKRPATIDVFRRSFSPPTSGDSSAKRTAAAPRTVMITDIRSDEVASAAKPGLIPQAPSSPSQRGVSRFVLVGVAACAIAVLLVAVLVVMQTMERSPLELTDPGLGTRASPSGPAAPVAIVPEQPAVSNVEPTAPSAHEGATPQQSAELATAGGSALDALKDSLELTPEPPEVPRVVPPPKRTPPARPAETGWENFQGPTGGYERKVQ